MKHFFAILALLLIAGCAPKVPQNSMVFDNVYYFNQFPISVNLNNEILMENDELLGANEIIIIDSMMIISTNKGDGAWDFVSLPEYKLLGSFLRKGKALHEFTQSPNFTSTTFFKENGKLYAAILDFSRGAIYKMNISESLENQMLSMSTLNNSIPNYLSNFVYLNDNKYLIKEINDKETKQIRSIYNNNRESTKNIEKLNLASVLPGKDFNLMSTATKCNSKRDRIVEMPIGLNHINLYSLDDSFSKTICFGKKIDDIDVLQHIPMHENIYPYASLSVYDDFFGVIYINDTNSAFQEEKDKLPSIQLFNWEGEPLAELKLNRHATDFAIDTINKHLYIMDHRKEGIFRYDISDLLDKIM